MNVKNETMNLKLNLKLVCLLLVATIVAMLLMWMPWESTVRDENRTVSVTGEATVKAVPDLYVFYPSYELEGATQTAKLDALTAKSDDVVAKLKELGVPDAGITTNASSYRDYYNYFTNSIPEDQTVSLSLTIEVENLELAQKVQDYLLTTKPQGQITPQPSLSKKKQREIADQARDEATKNARAKAEQTVKNLGAKLGDVKTVSESSFGGAIPMSYGRDIAAAEDTKSSSLSVQPGQQDVDVSVTVSYYLK